MFDERSPIYRQIAEQIRTQVLDGTLAEDGQVMSTTQYASFYRINPATAAKAFAELVDEGVLYKRRGVGMFVAPGARDDLLRRRRAAFVRDVVEPMVGQARALGIPTEAIIDHVRSVDHDRPDRPDRPDKDEVSEVDQ